MGLVTSGEWWLIIAPDVQLHLRIVLLRAVPEVIPGGANTFLSSRGGVFC